MRHDERIPACCTSGLFEERRGSRLQKREITESPRVLEMGTATWVQDGIQTPRETMVPEQENSFPPIDV